MKDWDKIAKYEKHFREKHGDEFLKSVHDDWSAEDEEAYRKESDALREKLYERSIARTREKKEGYTFSNKLLNNDISKNCPVCSKYLFEPDNDIYLVKFDCCKTCYVTYVEYREDRWESGWRPDKEINNED